MRALAWQGRRDVRVENVPDPHIEEPTDVVVRITSTGICGSDLHLYEVLRPCPDPGDVLGHEPMGVEEEVGGDATVLHVGDRVVVPFNLSCGWVCTPSARPRRCASRGRGAASFGYTKPYGQVPGRQANCCACRPATPCRSWFPRGRPMTGTSTCPMCCRPPGRPSGGHPRPGDRRRRRRGRYGVPRRTAGENRAVGHWPSAGRGRPETHGACGRGPSLPLCMVRRGGTVSVSGVYRCPCSPCSTSRSSCGWDRPTSGAGCPSFRSSTRRTCSGWTSQK